MKTPAPLQPQTVTQQLPAQASPKQLRKTIRLARRQLSRIQKHQHSQVITRRIVHSRFYRYSRHIALYLSTDGEVDLAPLIRKLHSHYHGYNKKCYLPVILSRENGLMAFAPYNENTRLRKNSFGILEPVYQKKHLKSARQLDLILAPLVAFDRQGNRMGMGGGFYDRTLSHLKQHGRRPRKHHPMFVGIAHELQQVDALQIHSWDIPLYAIITERRLGYFTQSAD